MSSTMTTLVLVLLVAAGVSGCFVNEDPDPFDSAPHRQDGVVVASHPRAAEAGAAILSVGGNAVDAAAAVQFALNVVQPPMSGIGGGAFLVIWLNESRTLTVIDARETAPAASTPDQFLAPGAEEPQPFATAHTRGYAVGVPGTLKGFATAVERYGTMGLNETLEPAIALARDGFQVDPFLAAYLADPTIAEKLRSWPATARVFYKDAVCPSDEAPSQQQTAPCVGGQSYAAGETLVQPDLAKTFAMIRDDGLDAFYSGPIAQAIVDAVAVRDGRMTVQDVGGYSVIERPALVRSYGPYDVATVPPPGGGVVVLHMLALLEPFALATMGQNSADALHLEVEAMHLAYADRARFLGDPDFVPVPTAGLLHPDYVGERRSLIDVADANANVVAGDPWTYDDQDAPSGAAPTNQDEGDHTTHFVVADSDGNVVSVTTTIESVFGSGMVVPGYGFLLNNELTDFDFVPGGANQVEPGKRPRSSMSPTIAFRDGLPIYAGGSPGGSTIITTVFQSVLNVLEFEMDLDEAVAAPRIYSPSHGSGSTDISWERGIPSAVLDDLRTRGHSPAASPANGIGAVQAILRGADGAWRGTADDRAQLGGVETVAPSTARSP